GVTPALRERGRGAEMTASPSLWRKPVKFIKTIAAAGLVAAATSRYAADITGAGATFPYPLYSKWADAYKKETGNGLNYQSIGSGARIKQIPAKNVTFGAHHPAHAFQ